MQALATLVRIPPRRRPIILGLAVALAATLVVVWLAGALRPPTSGDQSGIARGQAAPAIVGKTLDGAPFELSALRGRPVVVNFWGPSCVPCRDEFPLFKAKLVEHAADGLIIVGILMRDAPAPALDFIAQYGATWPTVDDPDGAIRTAYRAVARPQSYFIDRSGILREIQVGQVADADFERLYASISK